MRSLLLFPFSIVVVCLPTAAASSEETAKPIVSDDLVFIERDGLLAVEAEHFFRQTKSEKRAFHLTTSKSPPDVEPDGDPPHAAGASGGAYLEILPDTRRTHADELRRGVNFSPEPGKLAVLHYRVEITTPGRYYVWVRAFSTGTEDNGLHAGIDGRWPASGQRLQWCEGKGSWRWESKQRTPEEHCGEPHRIYLDIEEPGEHTIQFSMREDGFEFDKWLITRDRELSRPSGVGPRPTASGPLPEPFPAELAGQPSIFRPAFYAFQNGVDFGSFENEAQTLEELGFDGISQVFTGGEELAERVAAYEKVGLKVLSIYLDVGDEPISADVVKPLAHRGALIELTVRRRTPKTVAAVRKTAEMASALEIRVALYPHHGFSVATTTEAMDLAAKVDHPDLGVMFNLCHFLRNEKAEDLESVLEKLGPRLFAVSTCGADLDGKSWDELIQPLDEGSFPQERLFRALRRLGFRGPVGLQCYGVPGDKKTNLERSMEAWKRILEGF